MRLSVALAVLGACGTQAQNLIDPNWSAWTKPGPVWSVDALTQRNGAPSLHYSNANPNQYILATQSVKITPQTAYVIACWIKTTAINGPDSNGATIALEWKDKDGKFLGGFYPKGVMGTKDWTKVTGTSALSPSNAATATVVCYARKACVGVAWFSEFSMTVAKPEPWSVTVMDPWYRGRLDGIPNVRADVRLPRGAELTGTLTVKLGNSQQIFVADAPYMSVTMPTKGLLSGSIPFSVEWKDRNGASLGLYTDTLTLGTPVSKLSSFRGMNLLIDGKPFFPLGIYDDKGWVSGETPARLVQIASAGFNCVLPYGLVTGNLADVKKYLDSAQTAGLKVIVSLKDLYPWSQYRPASFDVWTNPMDILKGVVGAFKNHPAVLAWYVNDEGGPDLYDSLRANYDVVVRLDPNHPCYAVTNQPESAYRFVRTTDAIGVDPYPVPGSPLSLVSDWVADTESTRRPCWPVIQAFNKSDYQPGTSLRGPTSEEIRAMAFLAIASGADGLMVYSYYNMKKHDDFATNWAAVTGVCADVKKLLPAINSGVVLTVNATGCSARVWKAGDKYYVLVVNPTDQQVTISVQLPAGPTTAARLFGATGLDLAAHSVRGTLPSFGVAAYVVTK